jgi:hypothetical protein
VTEIPAFLACLEIHPVNGQRIELRALGAAATLFGNGAVLKKFEAVKNIAKATYALRECLMNAAHYFDYLSSRPPCFGLLQGFVAVSLAHTCSRRERSGNFEIEQRYEHNRILSVYPGVRYSILLENSHFFPLYAHVLVFGPDFEIGEVTVTIHRILYY